MANGKVIARNVVWNWAGTICDAAAAFIIAPFLVHSLGATSYGLWILIGSMSSYFGLLDLGVRGSVGRYIAYYRAQSNYRAVNETLSTAFAACAGIGLVVLAASPWIRQAFLAAFEIPPQDVAGIGTAVQIICINLAAMFSLTLFDGTLWASQRFDYLNAIDIPALTRLALTYYVINAGYGVVGLATMTLTVAIAVGLLKAAVSFRLEPELRISPAYITRGAARQLLGYGAANFTITVARMTRLQASPMIIGALLSPVAVTFYSIGRRLVDYTDRVFSSASGVLTPVAAVFDAKGEQEQQVHMLLRGGRSATALSVLMTAFYLCMGKQFIHLWMGSQWEGAYTLLVIFALGECIVFSQSVTGNILMGRARHKVPAGFLMVELVCIAVLAVMLSRFGVVGLCVALAIPGATFRGIAMMIYGCRTIGVPLSQYARKALFSGIAYAAIPVAILAFATFLYTPATWAQFVAYTAVYGILAGSACILAVGIPIERYVRLPNWSWIKSEEKRGLPISSKAAASGE